MEEIEKKELSIALVSSYPFTKEPGGVRDFILGLRQHLQAKGHKVTIIAPGSKEALEEGKIDFILGRNFRVATDQTQFRISLSRKRTAKKILQKINPDIIVLHEPFVPSIGHTIISAMPKKKDGKPRPIIIGQFHVRKEDLSISVRAAEFIGKHIIRRPVLRRGFLLSSGYVSTINNNLDARIAVSEATKKFWQKKLPADYKVIYNGIDIQELTPDPTTPALRGARKIIFFAGRHDTRKGIDDLINAFNILLKSDLKNIKLMIAGKGEMTDDLQKLVKELDLHNFIKFVGVLSRADLIKTYRTADLVVAPSTDGEGFNRTIAEARACGTLVVCTNIEGQDEAIGQDLSNFMARPHDPEDLSEKIRTVLDLPEIKKQEIINRGIKDVKKRFDFEEIAKEHIDFYQELIKQLA